MTSVRLQYLPAACGLTIKEFDMFKKLILLSLISFLLLSLQGCLSVPGVVEAPTISIEDVSLQNLSLTRGTALIRLNLTNPNAFALPLRGVRYGLSLNGRQVANGAQAQQRSINARETVAIDIPVQMNLSEIFSLIPSIFKQGQAKYTLQGAVDLPIISIPFSRTGGIGASQ